MRNNSSLVERLLNVDVALPLGDDRLTRPFQYLGISDSSHSEASSEDHTGKKKDRSLRHPLKSGGAPRSGHFHDHHAKGKTAADDPHSNFHPIHHDDDPESKHLHLKRSGRRQKKGVSSGSRPLHYRRPGSGGNADYFPTPLKTWGDLLKQEVDPDLPGVPYQLTLEKDHPEIGGLELHGKPPESILVADVKKDSAGHAAGVSVGDQLIMIDDNPVSRMTTPEARYEAWERLANRELRPCFLTFYRYVGQPRLALLERREKWITDRNIDNHENPEVGDT